MSKTIKKRRNKILKFGWQQCLGKTTYKTEEAAKAAASKLNQRYYECDQCRWWHLTSSRRRKGAKP